MTTVETIQEKVTHLPPQAQEEVLEAIEQIAGRYQAKEKKNAEHPLTLIANMATDVGVTDLAERHDFYSNGKLED